MGGMSVSVPAVLVATRCPPPPGEGTLALITQKRAHAWFRVGCVGGCKQQREHVVCPVGCSMSYLGARKRRMLRMEAPGRPFPQSSRNDVGLVPA